MNWSATAVDGGGVEIKPLSQEEALARQDEIRQLGWFAPNWEDATIDAVRVAERYWRKYCDVVGADYKEYLLRGDEAVYMAFIDWMAAMARQKGRQRSQQTYKNYWKWLSEYYALHSKKKMDGNVLQQMRRFLNSRFRADHKVGVRQKEKHTLSAEDLAILMRQDWLYGRPYPLGIFLIYKSLTKLFCAITGTRPKVLFPAKPTAATETAVEEGNPSDVLTFARRRGRPKKQSLSDVPDYVRYDELPRTVCYGDVDLFVIRNPEGGKDVLVAVIDFRNLKGRQQGAEGTKFMMHQDYQLAYCVITYILALAHHDKAFKNERLTPELILRLCVPDRLHTLPIRWKEDMLRKPLIRHIVQTPYGMQVHPTEPMRYGTSDKALKQTGEEAGYEIPVTHYAFRRWTANEANRAFTDQERNRILGHSGTKIFEKYYNDHFIHRDVQSVVLLRPQQAQLCRAVAQMNRKRDPRAPKDITDEQRRSISRRPRLVELRRERRQLRLEMVARHGSMRKAGGTEIHERHKELGQQIPRLRDQFRREELSKIKQSYFATMPVDEVDKQIDQMLCQNSDTTSAELGEDEWEPPKSTFSSAEHERIADAFFGPDAETLTGEEALSRRIQVINDLVAFSQLEEPSLRAKMCRWAEFEDAADADVKLEENSSSPQPDPFEFPSDQCIFCASKKGLREFRPREKQRPDSLRRHLENVHLNRFPKGPVPCPREICNGQEFENEYAWLSHAATVHKYDLHVKLHRSATLPRSIRPSTKPSTKPAGIVFANDGEIGGSTTEDSAIGTEGSSSSASMSSSSSSECLDVIDPLILAESERLVIEGEAP